MKVWALKHRSALWDVYWTGNGLMFVDGIGDAALFARRVDAERILSGNLLLDAEPVEVETELRSGMELPDGGKPHAQSAAVATAPSTPNRG